VILRTLRAWAYKSATQGRIGRLGLLTAALVLTSLLSVTPAQAILRGQADGTAYPYVGAIDARPPAHVAARFEGSG
jgi:hypothetical protein